MEKNLVYQVCLGEQAKSKLYSHCIDSVKTYCVKHNISHVVQTQAKLRIAPDPFMSNRSKEATSKHGGFLPIYEKENAFSYIDSFDKIAIIDADIYIREDAPNIFDDFGDDYAWGGVCEREMPINDAYKAKIINYSAMQYANLQKTIDFKPNNLGYEFFNMGMILLNSKLFKPFLKNQTPEQFIRRTEFMEFVNGTGNWKWSTDQTLLNYFLKKYDVPVKHMDHVWNGLFTANTKLNECHFIHFFLKDKLPNKGENVEELMAMI